VSHITPTEFNQKDVYVMLIILENPQLAIIKAREKANPIKALGLQK
jgi:hypothetical protein